MGPDRRHERRECDERDFLTRFRRKHHSGYRDGDVWNVTNRRVTAIKAMTRTPAFWSEGRKGEASSRSGSGRKRSSADEKTLNET